jgi:hypothetical protein
VEEVSWKGDYIYVLEEGGASLLEGWLHIIEEGGRSLLEGIQHTVY